MDPDDYQHMANARRPGDDEPTAITARLAEKCAAIVRAYVEGHSLYEQWLPDVVGFLTNAGYLARNPDDRETAVHVAESAHRLLDAPWPQIGPPTTQPD